MIGSASSFGTGGKIFAATYKRQIRLPGSLGGKSIDISNEAMVDISSLSVKKYGPLPSVLRLNLGDSGIAMQRVLSAPTYLCTWSSTLLLIMPPVFSQLALSQHTSLLHTVKKLMGGVPSCIVSHCTQCMKSD